MRIGPPAHKELFRRTFLEGHRSYEPESLPWPVLDGEALALLRSLPFWTFALQAEEDAGPLITACAALERDPLVREALQLQADEETRHAGILRHMSGGYGRPAAQHGALRTPRRRTTGRAPRRRDRRIHRLRLRGVLRLVRRFRALPARP